MSIEDKMKVFNKLRSGGEWLGTARTWMQSNVPKGDTLNWGSTELITIPFCKLEEFALLVATAAVYHYEMDNNRSCMFCSNSKGGLLGNENLILSKPVCDYCTSELMSKFGNSHE